MVHSQATWNVLIYPNDTPAEILESDITRIQEPRSRALFQEFIRENAPENSAFRSILQAITHSVDYDATAASEKQAPTSPIISEGAGMDPTQASPPIPIPGEDVEMAPPSPEITSHIISAPELEKIPNINASPELDNPDREPNIPSVPDVTNPDSNSTPDAQSTLELHKQDGNSIAAAVAPSNTIPDPQELENPDRDSSPNIPPIPGVAKPDGNSLPPIDESDPLSLKRKRSPSEEYEVDTVVGHRISEVSKSAINFHCFCNLRCIFRAFTSGRFVGKAMHLRMTPGSLWKI